MFKATLSYLGNSELARLHLTLLQKKKRKNERRKERKEGRKEGKKKKNENEMLRKGSETGINRRFSSPLLNSFMSL